MRVALAETSATPVHAVRVGDRLKERRTGEVRTVTMIARTLTEFRIHFDDETYIEAGVFDPVLVVQEKGTSDADG